MMFEVRVEGREAVNAGSLEEAWRCIDQAYAGRFDNMFWSIDGVAADLSGGGWKACCQDPERLGEYIGLLEG